MIPNLKLTIDIKADIDNAKFFIKNSENSEFVNWFLPLNFQYITSKKFSFPERNKIISEYTKHIYKINGNEIKKGVNETKNGWGNIKKKFYEIVDNIFQGHAWPKGQYIGFASIYLMYPRNIKKKIFYFPYKKIKWYPPGTIAHEMMHFIFFDFIEEKYKIKENTEFRGKNPKYVWQVSETFNTVIENWKPYKNIFNEKNNVKPYPGCEIMYQSMTQQWNKKQDINEFLDKWLLYELT